VVAEFGRLLVSWPELRGSLFRRHRSTVFKVFRARVEEAGIPERACASSHTQIHEGHRAFLRAGVPVTAVQQLLDHADIATTTSI